MKVEDLITDEAVNIVFKNTSFGRTHRQVIADELQKVKKGCYICHTASLCLQELGLATKAGNRSLLVTRIGNKYLEILN